MTEETIFDAALAIRSPQARSAYLRDACGADGPLRHRVEALLRAHETADDLLDAPAAFVRPDDAQPPGPSPRAAAAAAEAAGAVIDRYKLLQRIGQGGFGTVWMAEQREPVKRKVALKIIKLGMDTRQVIARFEAERQALAMMDHPNIARVLDAGATAAGRPYFVMELVRGVPITEYCDTNNLPTRGRLELFARVCRAIQHAHQKGVVHRDVKPSNVLVTLHDGVPVPKVIDFGIAKATSAELTERTLFTEHRQMIGTPAYMSPEQAEMSGLDIDTRSDIYSLGVLLYELLTGTTPFTAAELMRAGLGEMQRIIREQEPAKPSSRVSTLGDERLTAAARHRGIDPARLTRDIRGDLDWIVMKALEKDRTRRFDTANALADDVGRYLANEPVAARPAGAAYRVRKFVRRHRAGTAAGLAVAAALVLGIAGTTVGMVRARTAQAASDAAGRDAIEQKNVAVGLLADVKQAKAYAERQARRARDANDFMRDVITSAQPTTRPADGGLATPAPADVKVSDVLRQAAAALDRLQDQPELELDARLNLAKTFELLNDMPAAAAHYKRAVELSTKLTGPESEPALQATVDLLYVTDNTDGHPDTEARSRALAETVRRRFGPRHPLAFDADNGLGMAMGHSGKVAEAEAVLRDVVARVRAAPDVYHPKGSARYFNNLATLLARAGRSAEAEALGREALAVAAHEVQTDPRRAILFRTMLVRTLYAQGKTGEATAAAREAVEFARRQTGAADVQANGLRQVLATLDVEAGRFAEAARLFREVRDRLPADAAYDPNRWLQEVTAAEAELHDGPFDAAYPRLVAAQAEGFRLAAAHPDWAGAVRVQWSIVQLLGGFRPDRPWRSAGVRQFAELAAWQAASRHNWPASPPAFDWRAARFRLVPWSGPANGTTAAAAMTTLPATGPVAVDSGLDDLRGAPDPAPGLYLFSMEVPRTGAFAAQQANWVLVGPWDVDLFQTDPMRSVDDPRWPDVFATAPAERRREATLDYEHASKLPAGFGPSHRMSGAAASAVATVRLPPGGYRLDVVRDGKVRISVDGQVVYDEWAAKEAVLPVLQFGGEARTLKIEWAAGLERLRVALRPAGADEVTATAGGGWAYVARSTLERVDAQIHDSPSDAKLRRSRMTLLSRLGRFEEASAELAWLATAEPGNALDAYRQGCLLAYLGRADAYRSHGEQIVAKFGRETDPSVGERLAMGCLLLPSDAGGPADVAPFAPLVDRAVVAGGRYLGYFQMAKGLHEYRRGPDGYAAAADWARQADARLTGYGKVTNHLVRAMALQKAGHRDDALSAWKLAREGLASDARPGADDLAVVGFENWLTCHTLLREAEPLFAKPE